MSYILTPEALLEATQRLITEQADIAALTGLSPKGFGDFPGFAGALLQAVAGLPADLVTRVYAATPDRAETSLTDIFETARRNFEPGGAVGTLLFARGVHAVMGHRVAHWRWQASDPMGALAVKARCARAFGTDIHPGVQIGAGFWLDHGLGFVAGETVVIGRNVSIWHNVTLGSTLTDSGPHRHPRIADNVVIGAGACVLGGNISIETGANIAAGAVVTSDVPASAMVAAPRAQEKGPVRVSFAPVDGD